MTNGGDELTLAGMFYILGIVLLVVGIWWAFRGPTFGGRK